MSPNSSKNSQKPDLDESINVLDAHDTISRENAASSREKSLRRQSNEAIPFWLITTCLIACGAAIAIASSVFGGSGDWPGYSGYVRAGYERAKPPGAGETGPVPKTALLAYSGKGEKIYSAKCAGCHNPGGSGDGANYPTLIGSKWVMGDTQKFAMIILNGLQGPISTGKVYGAGVMPAQGTGLTAEDLAGLMTYVRNSWGNESGDVISTEMAVNALDVSASRDKPGSPVTADEITAKHMVNLPGETVDPATMVNPATLAPVE